MASIAYFSDTRFFQDFLNVTGWIHYYLPGVFEGRENERVNGALWTVPFEMFCYAIMSFLIVTGFIKKHIRVIALTLAMLVVGLLIELTEPELPSLLMKVINLLLISRGAQLLVAFLMGIILFQMQERVPYHWGLFAICGSVCVVAALKLDSTSLSEVGNRFVVLPSLVYMTIFLGLTPIPIPKILHSGDYSYGVYLYHDPLLQTIIGLIPGIVFIPKLGAVVLALFGLPAVALLATGSWHFIEKPILGLRKKFSFVARVRGVTDETDAGMMAPGDVVQQAQRLI